MLDAIRSYSNQLPRDISYGMLKSGIVSFVVGSLATQNVQAGVILGGAAMTASLIHGLTTPFFRKFFSIGQTMGQTKWYQTAIQMTVSLGLTQAIMNSFTHFRINMMAGALFSIGLSLALENFRDRPINKPMTYWVF